ncbi:unnamed protein product, partial [marine sediment metagenome]
MTHNYGILFDFEAYSYPNMSDILPYLEDMRHSRTYVLWMTIHSCYFDHVLPSIKILSTG